MLLRRFRSRLLAWLRHLRGPHRVPTIAVIALGLLVLLFGLAIMPNALAQGVFNDSILLEENRPNTAMVVFDGRPLLPLRDSANLSARERVTAVEKGLERWLDRALEAPELDLNIVQESRNNQPTITINGDQILTVTDRDLVSAGSPGIQADEWRRTLSKAFEQARYERTLAGRQRAFLTAAAVIAIAAIGQWLLRLFVKTLLRKLFGADRSYLADHLPRSLALLYRMRYQLLTGVAWLWGIIAIANTFPLSRQLLRSLVVETLTRPIVQFGNVPCSPLDLLLLILAIAALWWVAQLLSHLLKEHVLKPADVERSAQEMLSLVVRYGCFGFGVLVLLPVWGLNVSSIAIAASVLGVGIGLGVQNIANNFVSGLIVLLERPIRVGDFVALGDLVGTVERIGARATEVRTLDGLTIVVPNSRFLENEVINWSHGSPLSRIKVPVGVAYGSPVDKVRKSLLEAASTCPLVLDNPAPEVWFQEFADSALNFELLVWLHDPRHQFYLRSELNYRIYSALKRHGIEIPFPQRDLHVKSPELDRLAATLERRLGDGSFDRASPPTPERADDPRERGPIAQSGGPKPRHDLD